MYILEKQQPMGAFKKFGNDNLSSQIGEMTKCIRKKQPQKACKIFGNAEYYSWLSIFLDS